jgi:hypothetical protein
MSQRRMFSQDIVDSDAFLDMPGTSQLLYFHLSMRADDDGFVNPKKVMRLVGAGEDDLRVLIAKRFVLPFQSGVVVIKHWLIHNLIRKDRYKKTMYSEEKKTLRIKENGAYTDNLSTIGCQNDNQMATQVRLGKVRLGKEGEGIAAGAAPTPRDLMLGFIQSQDAEIQRLVGEYGQPEQFIKREVLKFIAYWTEPTASGKKQRWEIQKTFDYRRRLATWLIKANEWAKVETKKPFYQGMPMRQSFGKWQVFAGGEWKDYADKESLIEYK